MDTRVFMSRRLVGEGMRGLEAELFDDLVGAGHDGQSFEEWGCRRRLTECQDIYASERSSATCGMREAVGDGFAWLFCVPRRSRPWAG